MTYTLREPVLHATPVLELRPTQMTLGMAEVALKRKSWKAENPKKLAEFLAAHMAPVVVGPGEQRYLIDHHHLARALARRGGRQRLRHRRRRLPQARPDDFWNMMDFHGWTHPFDGKGRRRDYADLPKTVKEMEDDPYRSLAGELRDIGGYAKDSTPFSEFVWADFLRRRIKPKDVRKDFSPRARRGARHSPSRRTRTTFPAGARRTPRRRALEAAKSGKKVRSPDKIAHED